MPVNRSVPYGPVHRHGAGPYRVAVLHGGPGGAGEVAPLARDLAARGVACLEPHQTGMSVADQLAELAQQIDAFATGAVTLIGWSWGAWLGALLAAEHPGLVSRLVMVGSPPFRDTDHTGIKAARRARLSAAEADEMDRLSQGAPTGADLARLVVLMETADCVDPIHAPVEMVFDRAINRAVWSEAARMRSSGALLRRMAAICCPVRAIHGAQDAHPFDGVAAPLQAVVGDIDFVLLKRCGHKPWIERHARAVFFDALLRLIAQGPDG